jgi:hypothetical protein
MSMIADCFKVLLIDNVDKQEFATATLEDAGFEITSESTDVEGGGGLVAVLHSPRKENITLKDVRFHFDILAKQLGADIVVGAGEAYSFPREYVVETGKTFTLAQTPKTATDLKLTDSAGVALVVTTDYTLAGAEVTIVKAGIDVGAVVKAGSYLFTTSATTETIEINNKKYPNGVTCVLQTLEIAEDEEPLNDIQVVFDKCVFDGSVTINTNTKRDAMRHDMNLKVLNKIGNDIAGRIVRIPIV